MPPLPAAVMMCEAAKLVTLRSDRVPVGVPRSVAPSASQESSTTCRPRSSAMARMRSQSGALPIRFGHEDRLRVRPDQPLERVDVDVVGAGLDVDENRDQPGPDERRDVGGEGEHGGDRPRTRW